MLSQQLKRLDEHAAIRTRNAEYLDRALNEVEGITPQAHDPRCTRNGYYAYLFHYDSRAFAGVPISRFVGALNAEGIPTQASYPPLHELAVFRSGEYLKRLPPEQRSREHTFLKQEFPNTARAAWGTVWLPNPVLLGTEEETQKIVRAILKIQKQARDLL